MYEYHGDDFSIYFLASNVSDDIDDTTNRENCDGRFGPILELTHNHGTENIDDFSHFNGNEDGRQGFGHIGFLVDDVYGACDAIREFGYGFRKVSGEEAAPNYACTLLCCTREILRLLLA